MGQGFNCTALQAINAFSAVINGGYLMKPYVVSRVVDEEKKIIRENTPVVTRKVISKETSDWMRIALQQVVSPEGTGKNAMINGFDIGGKTGTGQQGKDRDEYTVSFIAYLPVEDPQYIALALIDHPEEDVDGSASAAPMLREVLMNIIEYKNIQPSVEGFAPEDSGAISIEDYTGWPADEAEQALNRLGLQVRLVGASDSVDRQFPAPGQSVTPSTTVILYRENGDADSGDVDSE
jgi:stage V sporulation protein D (sporulation-specific penicillin-binding protein)